MTLQPIDPTTQPAIDENGVALDPAFVAGELAEVSGDTGRSDVEDDDDAETVDSPDVDDDAEPIDA
jgi:hypothetical protein